MLTLFLMNLLLAYGEAPDAPTGTNYAVSADLNYFTTTTNYQAGGSSTEDLPNGGSFTDLKAEVLYTQDLDSAQRVYGGFNYGSVESYDGSLTRSNSGFNEILAGGQYWIKFGGYRFAPALDIVYPLFRVSRGGDDALLGEGALKVRAGSWMFLRYGNFHPFLYLGYEYRDEGRSHAIPYAIGAKWRAKPIFVQIDYSGFERLFDNADTENRQSREVFLRRVDGGSYRYYAINPSISEIALSAGYSFGSVSVHAGASYTVNGSSVAGGLAWFGGLKFSPSGVKEESENFDRFAPVDSGVDANFEDLDPTKPAPAPRRAPKRAPPPPKPVAKPQPVMQPTPTPQPQPQPQPTVTLKPKPKPKPRKPKKTKVDKLLEQTEKQLRDL